MIHTPNGWPASRDPHAIGVKSFKIVGTTETIKLRADVAPLLLYWLHRFNTEVEPVQGKQLDDWGYAYRANKNNPLHLSEHSAGTAVDANSTRHPNGMRGTFAPVQVARIHGILSAINRVDRVLEWGGDFQGTADEMHVDIVGTLAQVKAVIVRLHIQPDGSVRMPTPKPVPVEDDMKEALFVNADDPDPKPAWKDCGTVRRKVSAAYVHALDAAAGGAGKGHGYGTLPGTDTFWSLPVA